MKVFLSWSGVRSKDVAELLRNWIRCVLQATRPWVSTRDLDRGTVWFGEINDQLKDTTVGVICLTQENKTRPWILFEAGALIKGLSSSRICTFLIDLDPKDIEDPLAQFNHTFPNRESVKGLIETLNNNLGQNSLDHRVLSEVFDTYWPQFEKDFKKILSESKSEAKSNTVAKPRDDSEILAEILDNTRQLTNRVARLERHTRVIHDPRIPTDMDIKELYKQAQEMQKIGFPRSHSVDILSSNTPYPTNIIKEIVESVYRDRKDQRLNNMDVSD